MKGEIIRLTLTDFEKCGNIWDVQKQRDLALRFQKEIREGIRTTYVYVLNGDFVGEISVVIDTGDPDYTIPGKRLYISRLIVKESCRRQGIGKKLVEFMIHKAEQDGCTELSIGVDLENYPALRLYVQAGFDRVIYIGEDEYGRYVKLLRKS